MSIAGAVSRLRRGEATPFAYREHSGTTLLPRRGWGYVLTRSVPQRDRPEDLPTLERVKKIKILKWSENLRLAAAFPLPRKRGRGRAVTSGMPNSSHAPLAWREAYGSGLLITCPCSASPEALGRLTAVRKKDPGIAAG